jgi:HEPN domain-containing protein
MDRTIRRTIDDDVKSVIAKKLPREQFLKRLLEHLVYAPVVSVPAEGRHKLALLAGEGDEGIFLPVFTSEDQFASTPLARAHAPTKIPFDALMRQIRPDTGLIVNPFTDEPYSVRWPVLQEYIPDFGTEIVKQEVTSEWLERVNQEFTKSEMPHWQRPYEVIRIWSKTNSIPISMSSLRARKVYDWFRANTKPGSNWVGPLADATFYHDAAFWEVTVPLCYGSPRMNPLDMLHMPASVKLRFCNERNDVFIFVKFFADIYDYYYTVEDLRDAFKDNPLLKSFIEAGREHITQAAKLLLETRPNPKAAESVRTALEIFLKIFLISKAGAGEKDLKNLGHDLRKLLAKCLEVEPISELRLIESKIPLYPDISARYQVEEIVPRDLWSMYYNAITAGVVVMRPMSDRDSAKDIDIPDF